MTRRLRRPNADRVPRLLAVSTALVLLAAACSGPSEAEQATDALAAGLAAHQKGDLAAAASRYREVLVHDPGNQYAYYNLGLIDQTNGALDSAESNYRLALDSDPYFTPALFNLAIVRADLGDEEEAVTLYHQVIDLEPKNAAAHLNLGFALRDIGHRAAGDRQIVIALKLDQSLASRVSGEATPSVEPTPASASAGPESSLSSSPAG